MKENKKFLSSTCFQKFCQHFVDFFWSQFFVRLLTLVCYEQAQSRVNNWTKWYRVFKILLPHSNICPFVYFDLRKGAALCICWLKFVLLEFLLIFFCLIFMQSNGKMRRIRRKMLNNTKKLISQCWSTAKCSSAGLAFMLMMSTSYTHSNSFLTKPSLKAA